MTATKNIESVSFLPAKALGELRNMNAKQIGDYIAARLRGIKQGMIELAAAVFVAEEKGISLSMLPAQMLALLRRIAYGQVDPDLVGRFEFSGQSHRLMSLSSLALPDQGRIAKGETFPVAVASGDVSELTVEQMTREQFHAVFREGRVLPPEEQLSAMQSKLLSSQISASKPAYMVDRTNGQLIVNRPTVMTKRDLEQAMAELCR